MAEVLSIPPQFVICVALCTGARTHVSSPSTLCDGREENPPVSLKQHPGYFDVFPSF